MRDLLYFRQQFTQQIENEIGFITQAKRTGTGSSESSGSTPKRPTLALVLQEDLKIQDRTECNMVGQPRFIQSLVEIEVNRDGTLNAEASPFCPHRAPKSQGNKFGVLSAVVVL